MRGVALLLLAAFACVGSLASIVPGIYPGIRKKPGFRTEEVCLKRSGSMIDDIAYLCLSLSLSLCERPRKQRALA
jgi:hypothetical protein